MVESSVVTKIKGMMYRILPDGKKEIWDGIDFVVPPQESDAFFVATSLVYTANQTQSICPEDLNVGSQGIACAHDSDCGAEDEPTPMGNGLKTGRCVPRGKNQTSCEIMAWCPTEIDSTPKSPVLHGIESVTVLVKNHVAFPRFDLKRRNIPDDDKLNLLTCRYRKDSTPLCPIFSVADIVAEANESLSAMAVRGGIISFDIEWKCNLDFHYNHCLPVYSFRRLDNKDDKVAKGWNFRHAYYYYDPNGVARRDLVKLWGIRFVFNVHGRAGKTSYVNLAMNLGSGLGLLGIASIVCEFFLLNCFGRSDDLMDQKFTKLENVAKSPRRSNLPSPREHHSSASAVSHSNNEYLHVPNSNSYTPDLNHHGATLSMIDDL